MIPALLAKPKMKKKKNVLMGDSSGAGGGGIRGLGLHVNRPRSVFPCNEDDGNDFLIQSSAVRRIHDAHLQLVNPYRLVYSDT